MSERKPLPWKLITAYRSRTFRTMPGNRLRTRDEAVDFVKERGFILFWPIKGITYPSLWTAVAGDRPVADQHDDPGHVTWGWKDALLGGQAWYYAKVLRKKSTIISLPVAPY
ncbi:MAG: AlkZ-related protein, partial [Anaerolineales bacterium]